VRGSKPLGGLGIPSLSTNLIEEFPQKVQAPENYEKLFSAVLFNPEIDTIYIPFRHSRHEEDTTWDHITKLFLNPHIRQLRFLALEELFFANWINEDWLHQEFRMVLGNFPKIECFTFTGDVSNGGGKTKHLFPGDVIFGPGRPGFWSEAASLKSHIERLMGNELRERNIDIESKQIWRGGVQMVSEDIYGRPE
jgi:hypothetical protein